VALDDGAVLDGGRPLDGGAVPSGAGVRRGPLEAGTGVAVAAPRFGGCGGNPKGWPGSRSTVGSSNQSCAAAAGARAAVGAAPACTIVGCVGMAGRRAPLGGVWLAGPGCIPGRTP
jgi:hypothetical protein